MQTCYTADPAPMVYGDRFYIYIDRDEGPDYYNMNEWRVYSSADMVNWTDHGAQLPLTAFSWAKAGTAWAAQCIERYGKFYWYVCCTDTESNINAIGVAVSDSPTGPFKDALGKPMISGGWGYIDPTVFIDDDGQAYIYWGNPGLFYVKVNEDMISYSGDIVRVPLVAESFGKREGDAQRATLYEEGPWLYKRDKKYYLFWPGGPLPEHIGYSIECMAYRFSPNISMSLKSFFMSSQRSRSSLVHGEVVGAACERANTPWRLRQLFSPSSFSVCIRVSIC